MILTIFRPTTQQFGLDIQRGPFLGWQQAGGDAIPIPDRFVVANYGKRDLRAAQAKEQRAIDLGERYTVFSTDFDPLLRTSHLTLGNAVRALMHRTGTTLHFQRTERGLRIVLQRPNAPGDVTPSGGTAMLNNFSTLRDTTEAKKRLVSALLRGGWDGFRGLSDPEFRAHLLNLRTLVYMDLSVSASGYAKQAAKCWPRELDNLRTFASRMRENVMRD